MQFTFILYAFHFSLPFFVPFLSLALFELLISAETYACKQLYICIYVCVGGLVCVVNTSVESV